MKLLRLSSVLHSIKSHLGLRNSLGFSSYSTTTATAERRGLTKEKWSGSIPLIYRKISPIGDPTMSMWMTDKRYFRISAADAAVRLNLISKVQGVEQAENFFNSISKTLRTLPTYTALLKCYAYVRNVEKAEATMDKIRELGLAKWPMAYNILLGLYHRTGNDEKLVSLMHEMEENGIGWDRFTYGIRLTAYAAVSDVEGVDKTVTRMESDTSVVLDWTCYTAAASAYAKLGRLDKAVAMMKKSEGLVSGKRSTTAYECLITQYATYGKKDDVLRIWQVYKEKRKVFNKGYKSVISPVLKFDDLECVERIFEEWESENSNYDTRIPNFLIDAYCRRGLMEKAETFMDRIISMGGKLDEFSWYFLATGYLQNNQPQKAVEKMKEAIAVCHVCHKRWKPDKEVVAACLEYFKHEGDVDEAGNFINLLGDKNIISVDVQDRLLNNFLQKEPNLDALSELNADDALVGDGEALSEPEVEMSSSQPNIDFDGYNPLNTQSQAPSCDINLIDMDDAECESGRQTSQAPRRSTKRSSSGGPKHTSGAWNHFKREIINGEVKAICNNCGKALAGHHKQGTSHLLNHITLCLKKNGGKKVDGTSPKPNFGSVDNDILRQKITKMIIMHELPLSILRS
ncbi:hypothetical protein EZV62_015875 [Acer yangbiense]|uniref:BED-type domain-containing protein n=1 Tax=Acer yangbiense TaxID=1000413 RepID=A0A5C7HP23_9ROSI|nr:hypothetical protein EZV62_015875 [Acer yangbiense]